MFYCFKNQVTHIHVDGHVCKCHSCSLYMSKVSDLPLSVFITPHCFLFCSVVFTILFDFK